MSVTVNPMVTIYITNYNYGRFLKEAVESVVAQTFNDFELIIIDDGSDDNSRTIIEQYEKRKRFFTVFQKNKGLNASNNVALKMARGKYIMRLDADDYLAPQAVEIMVAELERNIDYALVFPDYFMVDEEGEVIHQVRRYNFESDVTLLDQPAHGACTMIRTEVLEVVGGYDQDFTRQDGYDLWLTITSQYSVKNINLPLFYYRQHSNNLTKDEKSLLKARSEIKAKQVKKRKMGPLHVLAVIPTRGEKIDPRSTPLRKLDDKALIDWTIDSALASELVTDIIVTTPDIATLEYVNRKYNNRILSYLREAELAKVNTAIEDTAKEAVDIYKKSHPEPDALLMLYLEYPFRSAFYIDKAINTLQLHDIDIVDGVRPEDDMFYVHNGHGLKPWRNNQKMRLERDELYRRVGGIQLLRLSVLSSGKELLEQRIGHIILDEQAAFPLRSEFDWKVAALMLENQN